MSTNEKQNLNNLESNTASHPSESLVFLLNHKLSTIRGEIAGNPETHIDYLKIYCNDNNQHVRCQLATNPNIDSVIVSILLKDTNDTVRSWLATNPNLSKSAREFLIQDESCEVICNLLDNPNLDKTDLIFIINKFKDMNGIAFKRFLKHGDIQSVLSEELGELEFELKNLPYGENMKADGYKAKIEEKKQQMNTNYNVNYVPYSNAQYILNKIQRHKLIDSDIFAILVNNPSILLRRVAAENIASDSPESLIDLLLLENDKTINYYIASNKFAPISVLIKLARTEDEEILVNLVDRESLEDEVIKEVLKINHSSKTVLNKLRNNPKAKSCLTKIDSEIAKLSN